MEPSRPDIDPEDSQSTPNPACEGLHYGYGLTVESCLDALLGLKAHDKRLERYGKSENLRQYDVNIFKLRKNWLWTTTRPIFRDSLSSCCSKLNSALISK